MQIKCPSSDRQTFASPIYLAYRPLIFGNGRLGGGVHRTYGSQKLVQLQPKGANPKMAGFFITPQSLSTQFESQPSGYVIGHKTRWVKRAWDRVRGRSKKSNFLFANFTHPICFHIMQLASDIGYISFFERISSDSSSYSHRKKIFFHVTQL